MDISRFLFFLVPGRLFYFLPVHRRRVWPSSASEVCVDLSSVQAEVGGPPESFPFGNSHPYLHSWKILHLGCPEPIPPTPSFTLIPVERPKTELRGPRKKNLILVIPSLYKRPEQHSPLSYLPPISQVIPYSSHTLYDWYSPLYPFRSRQPIHSDL